MSTLCCRSSNRPSASLPPAVCAPRALAWFVWAQRDAQRASCARCACAAYSARLRLTLCCRLVLIGILHRAALHALDDSGEASAAAAPDGGGSAHAGGGAERMDVDEDGSGDAMQQDLPAGPRRGDGTEGHASGGGGGGAERGRGAAGGDEEAQRIDGILEALLCAVGPSTSAKGAAGDEKELLSMASKLGKAVDKVMPPDMGNAVKNLDIPPALLNQVMRRVSCCCMPPHTRRACRH